MTQSYFDKFFIPLFVVMILIFGCVWSVKTIYYMNNPEPNKEITFNVVGITNSTNSSIVSIHFECIKFCGEEITSSYVQQKECWNECAKLGKQIQ